MIKPKLFPRIILFILLFSSISLFAQQKSEEKKNYHSYPYWIRMMEDPNTNYFEAIKAYNEYWKGREKPVDEEDQMGEGVDKFKEEEEERNKEHEQLTDSERSYRDEMTYQVKRFENWKQEVLPFVQEDGRILSERERMDIWKKQQEEMKKLNQQEK